MLWIDPNNTHNENNNNDNHKEIDGDHKMWDLHATRQKDTQRKRQNISICLNRSDRGGGGGGGGDCQWTEKN